MNFNFTFQFDISDENQYRTKAVCKYGTICFGMINLQRQSNRQQTEVAQKCLQIFSYFTRDQCINLPKSRTKFGVLTKNG